MFTAIYDFLLTFFHLIETKLNPTQTFIEPPFQFFRFQWINSLPYYDITFIVVNACDQVNLGDSPEKVSWNSGIRCLRFPTVKSMSVRFLALSLAGVWEIVL